MLSRSRSLARISLLCVLVILAQYKLPCLPAAVAQDNNKTSFSDNDSPADAAKRTATVRQLWAKYERLGLAAFRKNDWNLSLEMFAQAVQEAEMPGFDPEHLALSLDFLASVYQKLGKSQDSLQAASKAFEVRSQVAHGNKDAEISGLLRIGDLYMENGDYANAKKYLLQALNQADSVPRGEALNSRILDSLLSVASTTHDKTAAGKYIARFLSQDALRPADQNSAKHLEQSARLLWQDGHLLEARQALSRAMSIRNSCQSPDDPDVVALSRNLTRANLMLGINSQSEKDLAKVLSFDRLHLAPNSPDYLFDLITLSTLKLSNGQPVPARQLCQEVLFLLEESKDQNILDRADACSLLGRISAAENQWYEAISLASQACSLRQKLAMPEALSVYDYETLARAALAQGQLAEAESNFQKALSLRLERFSVDQVALDRVKDGLQSVRMRIAKNNQDNNLSAKLNSEAH